MREALNITRWDYLLIGDGSNTGKWQYEAGWACWIIDRANPTNPEPVWGGASVGTNIVAELMAYAYPLLYLSNTRKLTLAHVHIVTDCEFLTKAANKPAWQKKNKELWIMVNAFRQRGLYTHWHWLPRDTFDLNKFCHTLANKSRVAMKGLDAATAAEVPLHSIHVNGNEA